MKKALLLLIAISLFSCSKEEQEEDTPEPELSSPPIGVVQEGTANRTINFKSEQTESGYELVINEILISDTWPVNKTETYTYNKEQQLIKHSIVQKYPEFITTYERKLNYSGNTVEVSDDNGNTLTYTLNVHGYATECKYQTGDQVRFYDFTYSADNYLIRIEERIGNTFFASLDLAYKNGDLTSSTTFMNDMENKLLYTAGQTVNSDELPCITVAELYPMSTHAEALYAKLLGKMPQHHIIKNQPENNTDEWTDYSYQTSEIGKVKSIGITTHYKGIVYP